jgi:DNA-binding HxlR family transcriptional regulator
VVAKGHLNRPAACGGPEALTKWTVMVVGAVSEGPIRYNEIRRRVEGISQRMLTLTLTLKGLEQDGLVTCSRRLM